ncbi:MAG: NADH:ubiquinone reductase (Na(+)-transporting) subunit B [Prevotellaceae bacterium]|jgi:Na+-transporting NADH:ubiquinone oxidoreductase subunit B|nr:NADH:ubiquinone reductase (Na(+)-transporting) subunit B [Prevotellaceae bacterium]
MNVLKKYIDKIKPNFEKGGKFEKLHSVFEGFESFLFVPNTTSKKYGAHIHDAIDSKRTMTAVIIGLVPALLFGMYNVGHQHFIAIGETVNLWQTFAFGLLSVLPIMVVSYVVGLGIEFIFAQIKGHEIQEGFLVTGFLIPLIVPVDTPLWMIAIATAFAVIFAKEVFGGTGMNIFNVAIVTRVFLFFAYPTAMSGDTVWVRTKSALGYAGGEQINGFTGATPLGQIGTAEGTMAQITDTLGNPIGFWDGFLGLIPGSIGETSTLAILLGAVVLLITGVASWKTMFSVFAGGAFMGFIFNLSGFNAVANFPWYMHLVFGGFAFGAVFMATDPVTSARTETGKWIYGFLVGIIAILIRVLNPGYPEGMMLSILLMNAFAPLIDFYVVDANIKRRMKRAQLNK